MDSREFYDALYPLLRDPSAKERGQAEPRQGRQVWMFCPTHNDGEKTGRRSLSLHPKWGLKCWHGCDKMVVLEALGWKDHRSQEERQEHRNGHPPQPTKAKPPSDLGTPTHEWIIRDVHGNPVAVHGRFALKGPDPDAKTFRWRLPRNGWDRPGLGEDITERDLPPYGLEDLLDESLKQEPVWVIEGEKARDAAKAHGIKCAISWPGGSGQQFFPKYYMRLFADRDLILWPDNDAVGWTFMNRFAVASRKIAASSRMLLVPGAREKDDAYDWFVTRGGNLQTLLDSLDGAITEPTTAFLDSDTIQISLPPRTEKSPGPVQMTFSSIQSVTDKQGIGLTAKLEVQLLGPAKEQFPYTQRIHILSRNNRNACVQELDRMFSKEYEWHKLLNDASVLVDRGFSTQQRGQDMSQIPDTYSQVWHIDNVYEHGKTTLVFGDRQTMKSMQVQSQVIHAALGMNVDNRFSSLPGMWGWLDYEQTDVAIRRRGRRLLEGMDIDEVLSNLIYYLPADGYPIFEQEQRLVHDTERLGLVGWVFDSGMPLCGGDPSDNGLVTSMFNVVDRIRQRLNVTIVIICHIPKPAPGKPVNADSPLGAQAWAARADYMWFVERSELHGQEHATYRSSWINKKYRDAPVQDFSTVWTFDESAGIGQGPIRSAAADRVISMSRDLDVQAIELLRDGPPRTLKELSDTLMVSQRTILRIFRDDPDYFVDLGDKHWTIKPKAEVYQSEAQVSHATEGLPFDLANDPELAGKLIQFPGPDTDA